MFFILGQRIYLHQEIANIIIKSSKLLKNNGIISKYYINKLI